MKKIVATFGNRLTEEGLARLKDVAEVTTLPDASDETLSAEIRDAYAVLVGPTPYITRRHIESAPGLKHIARVGVGVDRIDIPAATEHGIIVTNTPDVTAASVAEFSMALLLALAKNIPSGDRFVREGRWDEKRELVNIELNGKTHGVVGMGRIGRRVAVSSQGFGMRVLYNKRNRDLEFEKSQGVEYVPLETLIRESDSISLHLPLTDETSNLFDRPQFEAMKQTALLINQSRGSVVNEAALVQALNEGLIGGYATDVYEQEPPDLDSELLKLKNVVVAPHMGGGTRESRIRSSITIAEILLTVMRGDVPESLVNREVLQKRSV